MHPHIAQNLAAARARDLRKRSAEMSRAKAARRGRADAQAGAVRPVAGNRVTGATPPAVARATRRQRRPRRPGSAARRLLRRIAAAVAECRYAQRRATALRASADRYMPNPGGAPGNYREFLLRTSGPLLHEPSAARRRAGQPVR